MTEKNRTFITFFFPVAIGFFIALFSPEDILNRFPILGNATHQLSLIFPPIAGYAEKSSFPQVSELYFAYMSILSPFYFWISVKEFRNNEGLKNWNPKTLGERIKVFLIGVILFSLIGYFALFINPGYDFNLLPINSSRSALAVAGYALSGSAGAFLWAGAYCFLVKIFQK